MIDAGCYEIPEEKVLETMEKSLEVMKPWLEAQNEFIKLCDCKEKSEYPSFDVPEDLLTKMEEFLEIVKRESSFW
jgi:polyribonucleotide nucleotidyltransferase